MTVSTTTSRVDYNGSGSAGPFVYPFRILAASDLAVTKVSAVGVEASLSYPADFSVSGVGNESGGSITLAVALLTGEKLVIRRIRPLTQNTDLLSLGRFTPATHEATFDHLTMVAQQHDEQLARAFKLAISATGVSPTIPFVPGRLLGMKQDGTGFEARQDPNAVLPAPSADKVVGWNPGGTGLENKTIDTMAGAVTLPGNGRVVPTLTQYLANNAPINPKDYSTLTIADGTTDARTAFANAHAAAVSDGRHLEPDKGTYRINSALTISQPYKPVSGAILKPAAGVTITISGPIIAQHEQLFDLSLGGVVVLSKSNKSLGAVSPFWWGAKGDAEQSGGWGATSTRNMVVTNGSTTVTANRSGARPFDSTDVGKNIVLANLASDYTLWRTHITTIASVTDGNTLVLAAAPTWSATNVTYNFGTNDTPALQAMLAAIPDYTRIALPPGSYGFGLATTLDWSNRSALRMDSPADPRNGTGAPAFLWLGALNGTMFNWNRAQYLHLEGVALDFNWIADYGIDMDQTGTGIICTGNTVERCYLSGRVAGISNSRVSVNNCEYHHIRRNLFGGGTGGDDNQSGAMAGLTGLSIANGGVDVYSAPPPVSGTPGITPSSSGGTIPAGTYYYTIHALNVLGVAYGSTEVSATLTGATSSVALTWAAVADASGYRIARGTASGQQSVSWDVGAVTSYTDTNAASSAFDPTKVGGNIAPFLATHVGKRIRIGDAGASAAGTMLDTTVASFISSSHITIASPSLRTGTLWSSYSKIGTQTGIGFLNGASANAKRIELYGNQFSGLAVGVKSLNGSVNLALNSFTNCGLNHWIVAATEPSIDSHSNAEFCDQHFRIDYPQVVIIDALRADVSHVAPNQSYLYGTGSGARVSVRAAALENTLPDTTRFANLDSGTLWHIAPLRTGQPMSFSKLFGVDATSPATTFTSSFESLFNVTGVPAAHIFGSGILGTAIGNTTPGVLGRAVAETNGGAGDRTGVRGEAAVAFPFDSTQIPVGVTAAVAQAQGTSWAGMTMRALQSLLPVTTAAMPGFVAALAEGHRIKSPDLTLGAGGQTITKVAGLVIEPMNPGAHVTTGVGIEQQGTLDVNTLNGPTTFGTRVIRSTQAISVAAAGTATIDASSGSVVRITAAGNFTMADPTNPVDGQELEIELFNNTGGAITITQAASFAVAIAPPATTKRTVVRVRYSTAGGRNKWSPITPQVTDYP